MRAHAVAQLTSTLDALGLARPARRDLARRDVGALLRARSAPARERRGRHRSMRMPGWREDMWTHLNLALRSGRARPENVLTDEELRSLATPVQFIWGQDDVYGGPEIGRRAVELMPAARIEVMPGNHAPFLDDPERCAALIGQMT